MKKKQNGFSVIEVLLVLVIAGMIGFVGWYVWSRNNVSDTPPTASSRQQQQPSSNSIKVQDVNVEILSGDDLSKLPENTPKGFVDAFREKIKGTVSPDSYGCTTLFRVDKISIINVKASYGWVEINNGIKVENSMICGGGAYSIWAFQNNKWKEVAVGNSEIGCNQISSPKVYSEFVEMCYLDNDQPNIPNPNGSITALTQ